MDRSSNHQRPHPNRTSGPRGPRNRNQRPRSRSPHERTPSGKGGTRRPVDATRKPQSGNRRPAKAPEPTFLEKLIKWLTFGLVDPTSKKKPARASGAEKTGSREPRKAGIPIAPTTPRLHVSNLNYSTTSEDLQQHFQEAGTIVEATVVTSGPNQRSKGFGFVEFSTLEEAQNAVSLFHGTELNGRTLVVGGAKERKQTQEWSPGGAPSSERESRPPRDRERNRESGGSSRSRGRSSASGREMPAMKQLVIEQVQSPVLIVGPVGEDASDEDIISLFEGIGVVQEKNPFGDTDAPARSFRIELTKTAEAQKAVECLHGKQFLGQKLSVVGADGGEAGA